LLIKEITNSKELTTATKKWEYLKYKIRQFTISFCKIIKKDSEKQEVDIINHLIFYCNRPNPTEDDRQKILNLQPKLDEIYSRMALGARDGEMKLHEAMRLSPDCSGKRFKASRVSRIAPSGAYLK